MTLKVSAHAPAILACLLLLASCSATPVHCPRCGSPDVVPIAYGLAGAEGCKAARDGKIVLGGCVMRDSNPD